MKKPIGKRRDIFKRLNTHYRVVFIDDESLEELASFRLTMRKLYILLSSLFVMVVLVTVFVLLATPLKYYIPGYGSNTTHKQVIKLKQNVDSLMDVMVAQQEYADNIMNVINGNTAIKRDTHMLDMTKVKQEAINSMLPAAEVLKKDAIEGVKQDNKKIK
jgi:hypothetical protein